jgi:diadenosine tetraphosphate (Ap4A) HIT family hydrolase
LYDNKKAFTMQGCCKISLLTWPNKARQSRASRGEQVVADMADISTAFHDKYKTNELVVLDGLRWRWSLRPIQSTLGASLLSVRGRAQRWADIDKDACAEMLQMVKLIEEVIPRQFKARKMNYVMLMLIDPLLHFHILPRYSESREFFGESWTDASWPGPPNLGGTEAPMPTLRGIRDHLKTGLGATAAK